MPSGGWSTEEVIRPQAGKKREAAAIAIFDDDELFVDIPEGHGEQSQASQAQDQS